MFLFYLSAYYAKFVLQPSEKLSAKYFHYTHIKFHLLWLWTLSTSKYILFFLYNEATVNNTTYFPFRQKLKTLQNKSLNTKYQLYSLSTCRAKKTSLLKNISNFNKTTGLSGNQPLNKNKVTAKNIRQYEFNFCCH